MKCEAPCAPNTSRGEVRKAGGRVPGVRNGQTKGMTSVHRFEVRCKDPALERTPRGVLQCGAVPGLAHNMCTAAQATSMTAVRRRKRGAPTTESISPRPRCDSAAAGASASGASGRCVRLREAIAAKAASASPWRCMPPHQHAVGLMTLQTLLRIKAV